MKPYLALISAAALSLTALPALAQQVSTVQGTQTTASGSNAKLNCGQIQLSRPGTIIEASTSNTAGFWINRGPVLLVNFAQASQATGYNLAANTTYYICPNSPARPGTSSVTVKIRH